MDAIQLRKDAKKIFLSGVKAVDPVTAVQRHLQKQDDRLTVGNQTYNISDYEGIYVIGAGKASAAMAKPIEELLGDRLKDGLVLTKYKHTVPLDKIRIQEAGHPVPDQAGVGGTQQIIGVLKETSDKDFVFCLISGGGSALLPSPVESLTLQDKQSTTQILLESGANIHEINAVRKHISRVKGGRLAELAYPSRLVSLILSDVIGDDLDSIASGPTVPDTSTYGDCFRVFEKYKILEVIPPAVIDYLKKGVQGDIEETPKPGDPVFEGTQNLIIGSNILAVQAAEKKAAEMGYNSLILSTFIEGETKDVARVHAAIAKEILKRDLPLKKPACIISGGETTVTIKGKGLGGRNQEFVLAAALDLDGWNEVVVLSGGTDGTDGPTDAAGAIADGRTVSRAQALGLNPEHYLDENDSYHFFQKLEDLLITGPTFTNVMDLRLVMVG